ncbi:hypothetical protein SCHPADRAFT_999922 [Schizopora paradoxa]|uniref:Uncharacterized protein n=1 Tax=Schizopora paradoxa TaxID=27342 RepID=A0A0H2RDK1_9AGAM|nr:hypothetical protein SCHPADRAFT_999922 [Schizopora paradoxa]
MRPTSQAARSARLNVLKPGTSSSDEPPTSTSTKNPRYIPPADGRCVINRLPPEVLAHAFELGTRAEWEEEGEEEDEIAERFGGTVSSRKIQEDDGDEDYEDIDEDEEEKDEGDAWSTWLGKGKGEKDLEDDDAVGDHAPFPVLVSHVCQHWRRVALDTPQLWTHIGVDETSHIEEVEEWISRAKACPLDIDIDIDDGGSDDDYDAEKTTLARACALSILEYGGQLDDEQRECFNPVNILFDSLCLLIPHMKQWQKICLQTTSFPAILAALFQIAVHDRANASAPLLETLWLSCTDDYMDPRVYNAMVTHYGEQAFRLFGCRVPCLRDVSLWGVPIAYELLIPNPNPPLPTSSTLSSSPAHQYHNLQELELAYMQQPELRPSYNELSAVLRGAPHLNRLKISDACFTKESPEQHVAPVRLPSLRHLELSDPAQQADVLELIRLLHPPALETLYLAFEDEDYSDAIRLLATQPMVAATTESDAARMSTTPGEVPDGGGGELILTSVRELKLAGVMCGGDALQLLYRNAPRVRSLFLNMSALTLEAATKLCLPWDAPQVLLGAGEDVVGAEDVGPHQAWQAANGIAFTATDLMGVGGQEQQVAEGQAATTNGSGTAANPNTDNPPVDASSSAPPPISKDNIPLPELTELTVSGMSGVDLVALVLMRKEMRVPIKVLRVDRRDAGPGLGPNAKSSGVFGTLGGADDDGEMITEQIWSFLRKTIAKVEFVRVDTEDSDDEDGEDTDDEDGMEIDGFELDGTDEDEDVDDVDDDDFGVDADMQLPGGLQDALYAAGLLDGPEPEDNEGWEDVDDGEDVEDIEE